MPDEKEPEIVNEPEVLVVKYEVTDSPDMPCPEGMSEGDWAAWTPGLRKTYLDAIKNSRKLRGGR